MTPDPGFPPIDELLPHRGPALLLERVLAHDRARTVCTVDPDAGAHFRDADGAIPAYVGLEFMAQTIAAHGGLLERAKTLGIPGATAGPGIVPDANAADAKPGFFVGTRRTTLGVDRFEAGQRLTVTAVHLRSSGGLHAFDCSIDDGAGGAPMVSGVLTVYLLESFEALTRDFSAND